MTREPCRSQSPQWGWWITKQSPVRCRCSRCCHSMDSILSMQNKDFTGDGKEFTKVHRVAKTKSYLHGPLEFGKSCEAPSWESSNLKTSSIRDKWHSWKSCTTSERRNFSSIATIRIGWKMVADSMQWNAIAICEMSQDLLVVGTTPCERRFGEWFKRPIIPLGAMVEYQSISTRDQSRLHQFGKKFLPGIFLGYEMIAVEFGKETLWLRISRNWKNGRIRNLSSKNQRNGSFDQTKHDDFIFPVPLKCIMVTRSSHTDLDVMQEKRVDDCWNVDSNTSLSDSWIVFTRFTLLKEKPPNGICGPGEIEKSSNDYLTRSCTARSMDENWESRTESRQTRTEKREAKTRQCSKMGETLLHWSRWPRLQWNSKMRGENWNDLWQQPCRAIEKLGLAPRRWLQSRKLHLMNPQGNEWNLLYSQTMRIALQAKGSLRGPTTIWLTKKFLCLKQWRFRTQQAAVDKEWKKARDNFSMGFGKSRARRRLFRKHKETKRKSTLLHWWTYVTSKTRS